MDAGQSKAFLLGWVHILPSVEPGQDSRAKSRSDREIGAG